MQTLVFADINDANDIGVAVKISRRARFLQKLLDNPGILRKVVGQHFDGAESAVQTVARQVHARHTAAADPLHHVVFIADRGAELLLRLFAGGHRCLGAAESEVDAGADGDHQ